MTKKAYSRLFCLSVSLLLLIFASAAEAAESYSSSLEKLSIKLTRLEVISNQLQMDYTKVEEQLQISLQSLTAAKEQSKKLQLRVSELELISKRQEYLLENANSSLKDLKQEVKAELNKHKVQKAIWITVAAFALLCR